MWVNTIVLTKPILSAIFAATMKEKVISTPAIEKTKIELSDQHQTSWETITTLNFREYAEKHLSWAFYLIKKNIIKYPKCGIANCLFFSNYIIS